MGKGGQDNYSKCRNCPFFGLTQPYTCWTCSLQPNLFWLPGAPFGPVHSTNYISNPAYLEFIPENILLVDPLAGTGVPEQVNHEVQLLARISSTDDPTYHPLVCLPVCLQDPVIADGITSTQGFIGLYITLAGLMDSMVPTSGPWSMLR
ncbi:hypothetical protein DSO57_1032214 [Entomophthora muscae]|uniref:Uncharacterized protein n=1 Tax=Entomophthora muscae TaxID=34485 RepID=A0ACC2TZ29_9FUNG|nr:hypothetical protein DSO57_1032214 [Entomophthora muscae]